MMLIDANNTEMTGNAMTFTKSMCTLQKFTNVHQYHHVHVYIIIHENSNTLNSTNLNRSTDPIILLLRHNYNPLQYTKASL